MNQYIAVTKHENEERPIPTLWRKTLFDIVETLKSKDFKSIQGLQGVHPLSDSEAERISGNIDAYGGPLTSLPEETWETSVYLWMRGYWEVIVDLYTEREGMSDLALFIRVYESGQYYRFEIESVNVP